MQAVNAAKKRDSWIGYMLSELPNDIAREARAKQSRPTIRAFPFEPAHKDHQKIVSFQVARLKNPHHKVFTTVGGEVEQSDSWISALLRESSEELAVRCLTYDMLQHARILAMETVPTDRAKWQSKLVVVVAVPVPRFHSGSFEPTGKEIKKPFIGTICETVIRLQKCVNTPQKMAELYRSALTEMRHLCNRG